VAGAIRSQPYFEETGAVSDCEEGVKKLKKLAACAAMGLLTRLTRAD
jgi:hypothetical protein